MTSLPTTARHGATSAVDQLHQSPWRTHLKRLTSLFPFQHATINEPNSNDVNQGEKSKWYTVHLGKGMISDVKRRAPFYWSDWIDAWDYRVVPATIYMYFANILPALAFSLDM